MLQKSCTLIQRPTTEIIDKHYIGTFKKKTQNNKRAFYQYNDTSKRTENSYGNNYSTCMAWIVVISLER